MPVLRGAASSRGGSQESNNPAGSADDATIGFDADGRVLSASASAAATLGYMRPEDMRGLALSALIDADTAGGVLHRIQSGSESESTGRIPDRGVNTPGALAFIRRDGTRVSVDAVVTPETTGGWITLLSPAPGGMAASASRSGGGSSQTDIAATLRMLADQTAPAGGEREICSRFAAALRSASGTSAVLVARSTGTTGLYETVAHSTEPGSEPFSDAIDLPLALIPQRGAAPVSVESLKGLALFDPVIIGGEESSGAYLAARAEYLDGIHLLVIATTPNEAQWHDDLSLLIETGALTLSGTLRTAELGDRLATSARAHEAVRQIGVLASQDLDGGFLEAARRVIARRLPVSAISIHAADPVTSRCYVAATTGNESEGLAPGFEWPLAGSIEQRVIKSGAPLFISASSPERVAAPPSTVAHWRAAGLHTVVAVPLREAGEVIAVLVAGFSSALSRATEVIRLLESVTPAVHLGVGLSSGRPGAAPEPDDSTADPGFVPPRILLAITRAAAESPDAATLFASVTEWLPEVVPNVRVAWGTIDHDSRTYHRLYNSDSANAAPSGKDTVPVAEGEYRSLDSPGLKLPEPGHPAGPGYSMRASVTADQRVLGVVTTWAREDEPYTSSDLARLRRVCEFIAGPLKLILDSEAARDELRLRDVVDEIGFQASGFYDPAQAFRTVRASLNRLFSYDRAMYIDIDNDEGTATVRFDSELSPNDTRTREFLLTSLPSSEIAESEIPLNISIDEDIASVVGNVGPVFSDFLSILTVPVMGGDGSLSTLLLFNTEPGAYTSKQVELAAMLSGQLTGAQAGWQAHRLTRQWTHELRDTHKQMNLILDRVPVALVSIDIEGVCTKLEGHGLETLGIRREDMLGKSVFEMTGKLPQLEDAIRQALRGVPASAITSHGVHSAEVWAQPVTEVDGSVTGVTLVGYDISERIRSKRRVAEIRELQRTIRDRTHFVSTASHELRNPLTSIFACADVLVAGGVKNLTREQQHSLSIIQKSAERLESLIGDLPSLYTGSFDVEIIPVNVSQLMQEIIETQLPIFSRARQVLTLSVPDVDYSVGADRNRLTQVIANLLSNASKHSNEGTEVCLDIAVAGSRLKISVIDNGPGIPADQLGRVWDRGFRLTNEGARTVPGKGLGLPIVRSIVELHGGTATIESTVDIGTTVTVTLPGASVVEIEATHQKPEEVKPAKAKPAGGQRKRQRRAS